MLRTRFLTALVALPVLLAITIIGGWLFALFVLAILLVGGWEYTTLLKKQQHAPSQLLTAALIVLPLGATWFERPDWLAPGLIALLIAGMGMMIRDMERQRPQPGIDLALAVFGGVYLGWLGSTILAIRMLDDGAYLVIVIYALIALADTAAYFVGSATGKHKMSPHVSPKKSWEGYAGGVIFGLLSGAAIGALSPTGPLTWGHGALLGLLIGVLGVVGDLGISAIKRQVGAKDSSNLIPGHGGILDRTDSVLVAAALGYYYLIWFVI